MNNLKKIREKIVMELVGHENIAALARRLDLDSRTLYAIRDGKDIKLSTLIKVEEELFKNG